MGNKKTARLCVEKRDYERLGLKRAEVEAWEDGLRTRGKRGEYEWWYSDVKLDGGGSLVIIFYTGPITAMQKGFRPQISLNFTYPDGREFKDALTFDIADCSFERERCKVSMKGNYIEAVGEDYVIHYESDRARADMHIKRKLPPWRPETGHISFAEKNYFAWMPVMPEGEAEVKLGIGGEEMLLRGTGYHDHNWGDTAMFWLMHHWYWGRAKIGPYQVISSFITAREEYGHEHFTVFLLGRDGKKIADDGRCITYSQTNPAYDEHTGKHYYRDLVYDYDDGTQRYRISYHQEDIIERFALSDSGSVDAAKTNALSRLAIKLVGLEPAYIRFTGTACIERIEQGEVVEKYESPALWELMYFGKDADV